MNLSDYAMKQEGTSTIGCPVLASIAVKAECSAATLYMIAKGHKQASAKLAVRIELACSGEVTRHDLRPDIFGTGTARLESAA